MDNPRALLLLCYQHAEPPLRLPRPAAGGASPLTDALKAAQAAGMEFWQVMCRALVHLGCLPDVWGVTVRHVCAWPPCP